MKIDSYATRERTLDEFDITFSNGQMMTLSVCKDEGDAVDFETYPHAIVFSITEKKGVGVDGSDFPPEEITIFTSHILAIQKRKRVIKPLTAEQKASWQDAVASLTKTTH